MGDEEDPLPSMVDHSLIQALGAYRCDVGERKTGGGIEIERHRHTCMRTHTKRSLSKYHKSHIALSDG